MKLSGGVQKSAKYRSIYLSTCLSVPLSLYVYLSTSLSLYTGIFLSLSLSRSLCTLLPACLSLNPQTFKPLNPKP